MTTPPPQQVWPNKGLAVSPFVKQVFDQIDIAVPSQILDLPCGTGRHTLWLASRGHSVTACDIDAELVSQVLSQTASAGYNCRGYVADAAKPLPFESGSFDLVLMVDFVHEYTLSQVERIIKPGGLLIYQSYGGRGGNWRQLLPVGHTQQLIETDFDIIKSTYNPVGPKNDQREVVRLVARKKG
jgi:SAM-dependent methyltransferase